MFGYARFPVLLICAGLLSLGCSAGKINPVGSEKIIERSGDKPEWIKKIPRENDEYYFFRGFKTSALTLEDGLTDARANAIRQVLEMIQAQGLVDYKKARVETGLADRREDIGSITEDGLKILSKTVASGVKELESYTEKVERYTPDGVRYNFNVYTLVRYPKVEFEKAVALAAQEKQSEVRAKNNAQAQEVLDKLDKGLPTK